MQVVCVSVCVCACGCVLTELKLSFLCPDGGRGAPAGKLLARPRPCISSGSPLALEPLQRGGLMFEGPGAVTAGLSPASGSPTE